MRIKGYVVLGVVVLLSGVLAFSPYPQADNPAPPEQPVKLIFIHHSTGENWLTDGYGDLGRTLGQNNYFVSDTNYGWGPNGIGDRTDIPNWTEWFHSADTPVYMQALFNESGQNASYTRTLADPGGENQIIMFKSCFPNSDLAGNPNDPPGTYEDLTVSGAKYVYNEILKYFATRPDKMFVVITAPPLSDGTHAANARAFNQWLLNDWLRENNYSQNNVFVYDFYNVLTGPDAHHRFDNGQIEHVVGGSNTLYYPSGDDHPSVEGSRKATEEFVPVLNTFYRRWKSGNPSLSSGDGVDVAPVAPDTQAPIVPPPPVTLGLIDDFEGAIPAGSAGWEAFRDEAASTSITCTPTAGQVRTGNQALQVDFDVVADSWATCALMFDAAQDWSQADGLSFYLFSGQASPTFDVDVYTGPPEARQTYIYHVQTLSVTSDVWVPYELRWEQFKRADWEENAGAAFEQPSAVTGLAFGFDSAQSGTFWIDDLGLFTPGAVENAPVTAAPPESPPSDAPSEQPASRSLPCAGAAVLPLFALGVALWRRQSS
jgi:hypothetical protein